MSVAEKMDYAKRLITGKDYASASKFLRAMGKTFKGAEAGDWAAAVLREWKSD